MTESDLDRKLSRDLAVYQRLSDRYQAHITIMWQAPALGLTAEAFLMTIALNSGLSKDARIIATVLGTAVALMSMQLMAKHRSISRRDDHALRRLEEQLGIHPPFKGIPAPGGLWAVKISSYRLWQAGLSLFVLGNIIILVLVAISVNA
jgi:hypothetical protein